MSKKRFTMGMENLLHEASQSSPVFDSESPKNQQVSLPTEENTRPVEGISLIGEQPLTPLRRSHGKKFSEDLQTFLQEAFDDSFEKYLQWTDREKLRVKKNKFCNSCEYFGNCLSEHLREVKNLDNSCNGFKFLLDWYKK